MNFVKLAGIAGLVAAMMACGGPVGGSASAGDLGGNAAIIRNLETEPPAEDTDSGEQVTTTCHRDRDGDGFGDPAEREDVAGRTCGDDSGLVPNNRDCDDSNPTVYPNAPELPLTAGIDNDCDGDEDEGSVEETSLCYIDSDGDGYGRSTRVEVVGSDCDDIDGYSDVDGDCNDGQPGIRPGALDVANGIDDDCDGDFDEDAQSNNVWCYDDSDGDQFGDEDASRRQYAGDECPASTVENNDDCDDNRATVNPARQESCDNGRDDDCDGDIDGDDSECEQETVFCWPDEDGDGYGDENANDLELDADPGDECADLGDYADNDEDCDDENASIHSGCGATNPDNGTVEFCWNGGGIDDVDLSRMQLVMFNEGDDGDDGAVESVIQTSGLNNTSDCIETTQTYGVGDVACVNTTFAHGDSGVPVYSGDEWFLAGCDGEPCDPIVTGIPSINGEQPALNDAYSDVYRTGGSRLSYDGVSEDNTPIPGRWFWATNWNGQGVDLCVILTDTLF